MKKGFTILFFFFFFISLVSAQQPNKNWQRDLNLALEQFQTCEQDNASGISPCNKFIGGALKIVYQVDDFYSKAMGRHMLVSEIAAFLQNNGNWTLLGKGYEQQALAKAQEQANAGKAVVAIYLNQEGLGHLSIILPGELKQSGTWGFQVPNSASFFMNDPTKSYVSKGLSYAYERPLLNGVMIYARN